MITAFQRGGLENFLKNLGLGLEIRTDSRPGRGYEIVCVCDCDKHPGVVSGFHD